MKNILIPLTILVIVIPIMTAYSQPGSGNGIADCRLLVSSVDCPNDRVYIDLEIKSASSPANDFYLSSADFSFDYDACIMSYLEELNTPVGFTAYHTHVERDVSGGCIGIGQYDLQYNGIHATDTSLVNDQWAKVSRSKSADE